MKICCRCSQSKNISCFGKNKPRKDGLHPVCKECRKKEKQNPARKHEHYLKHKDKYTQQNQAYVEANLQKVKKYKKQWQQANLDKVRASYHKNKHKHQHKLAWRCVLRRYLAAVNRKKNGRTLNLLGYTHEEFKNHLEKLWLPGMSWENWGEWHIDHIIPIVCFDKYADCSVVNGLNNLAPKWSTTRIINGVTYEGNLNKGKKLPTKFTFFIDLDGTLVKQSTDLTGIMLAEMELLPGAREKLNAWHNDGHKIIITTARPESMREYTLKQLEGVGIFYDQILFGVGNGQRILINNRKSDGGITALAINVETNVGIGALSF